MDFMKEYEKWLASPALSDAERAELESIRNDPREIESRFYGPLEFGTAGLRGIMAVGLHNMNIHVIRWATQGLPRSSAPRARRASAGAWPSVWTAGTTPWSSPGRRRRSAPPTVSMSGSLNPPPTPELSFAVREYRCQAGINVTASHNPKEYNGYKVYWRTAPSALTTPTPSPLLWNRSTSSMAFGAWTRRGGEGRPH